MPLAIQVKSGIGIAFVIAGHRSRISEILAGADLQCVEPNSNEFTMQGPCVFIKYHLKNYSCKDKCAFRAFYMPILGISPTPESVYEMCTLCAHFAHFVTSTYPSALRHCHALRFDDRLNSLCSSVPLSPNMKTKKMTCDREVTVDNKKCRLYRQKRHPPHPCS